MLTVRGLCKSFGRPAVDHLDLRIAAGEIYALLGPNGAGKTTTLRMVCGLLTADAGSSPNPRRPVPLHVNGLLVGTGRIVGSGKCREIALHRPNRGA